MKRKSILRCAAILLTSTLLLSAAAQIAGISPENQIFQFITTETFTPTSDPSMRKTTATAYLWIPPACHRVRGVLVLGQNVPEQWLVGHPAIRAACTDCDLAIMIASPTFKMADVGGYSAGPNREGRDREHGEFVQQILSSLAAKSGYSELISAPWLPIGESQHLVVPTALTSGFPDRCIAGIQLKDGLWHGLRSAQVPFLVASGTAAEWDLPKQNIFTVWKTKATSDFNKHGTMRKDHPDWPGSLLIEGGSAHFSCTEAMAQFIALYIRSAAKARLSTDGSDNLRPINLDGGYVAGLPIPGATPLPPIRYKDCTPEQKGLPWYFDEACAKAAYDMANINWNAQSQLPVFADASGQAIPFNPKGITGPLPITMDDDGITFTLSAMFLDQLPEYFVEGGSAIGHAAGQPAIEWLCGPFIPLGNNRFQVALDRYARRPNGYVRVWHPGNETYRLSMNPGRIDLVANKAGKPQTITFDAIADVKASAKEILLHATSDSGLPVRFFVLAGPAEIHGDRLVFTPVPARSKMPLTVTVAAWQWGRAAEPAVQTAEIVERSFNILPK